MRIRSFVIYFLTIIFCLCGLNSSARQVNKFINVNNNYEQNIEIGYPVVDRLENKVFGQTFSDQDLYLRLDRLEKSVFGSKKSVKDLSERVDKLSEVVLNEKIYTAEKEKPNIVFGQNYSEFKNSGGLQRGQYSSALYDLENHYFDTAYPSDPVNLRISRLEKNVFSETMEGYPIEDRIQRLTAYADAQSSDEFYQDQAKAQQYSNLVKGANALSLIFMILQFFL